MKRGWSQGLLIVLAAGSAFGTVIGNAIVYDADKLLHAARFSVPVDWLALASEPYWYTGLWRPVTLLFLGVQVQLAGEAVPVVLHTVSLALYCIVGLTLFKTSITLGASAAAAVAATVLFTVHPVHVEVVASVVGQAELLTSLALLGAVALWHRAATQGAGAGRLLGLIVLQLLAAGAKEQGYLLPVLLAGQQWFLPGKLPSKVAIRWLGLLTLVAVTLWVVRATVTGSLAGEVPAPYFLGLSSTDRFIAAVGVLPQALAMLVFPWHLGMEYGPPAIALDGRFGLLQAAGAAMIAAWCVAVLCWRTRQPLAAFGLWWAAITWLPSSSLIVPAGLLLADRGLFLPTVGLAFALSAFRWPEPQSARRIGVGAVALGVIWFGALSLARTKVWRDADTFFAAMTRDNAESYRTWFVRAMHEKEQGRTAEAERHLRQALMLWGSDPKVHEELGQLLRADGRCAEAIPIFREGLALDTARTQLRAKLTECEKRSEATVPAQAENAESVFGDNRN